MFKCHPEINAANILVYPAGLLHISCAPKPGAAGASYRTQCWLVSLSLSTYVVFLDYSKWSQILLLYEYSTVLIASPLSLDY